MSISAKNTSVMMPLQNYLALQALTLRLMSYCLLYFLPYWDIIARCSLPGENQKTLIKGKVKKRFLSNISFTLYCNFNVLHCHDRIWVNILSKTDTFSPTWCFLKSFLQNKVISFSISVYPTTALLSLPSGGRGHILGQWMWEETLLTSNTPRRETVKATDSQL